MARILRKTSIFHFLDGTLDELVRLNKPIPSKEALRLYRDVLKFVKKCNWNDPRGLPWSKILQTSARREFEQSRYENDTFILAKMLMNGREALKVSHEKFAKKKSDIIQHVHDTRTQPKSATRTQSDPTSRTGSFKHKK